MNGQYMTFGEEEFFTFIRSMVGGDSRAYNWSDNGKCVCGMYVGVCARSCVGIYIWIYMCMRVYILIYVYTYIPYILVYICM